MAEFLDISDKIVTFAPVCSHMATRKKPTKAQL